MYGDVASTMYRNVVGIVITTLQMKKLRPRESNLSKISGSGSGRDNV